MEHYYWNEWYSGWGWFLWFGMIFLIFSSFGNWGYTYRVHRLYGDDAQKNALNILRERYAQGEIQRDEFHRMKAEINADFKADAQADVRSEVNKQGFKGKNSPA